MAGLLGVIAGAMLSHQLKHRIPEDVQQIYETAVRYQFYHVFALLATALLGNQIRSGYLIRAGNFFMLGIVLFSGSLYIMSALITNNISVPFLLGILTPIGGIAFMLGWFFLVLAAVRSTTR